MTKWLPEYFNTQLFRLKVSKFQKQILLFSFEPKNKWNNVLNFALASKMSQIKRNWVSRKNTLAIFWPLIIKTPIIINYFIISVYCFFCLFQFWFLLPFDAKAFNGSACCFSNFLLALETLFCLNLWPLPPLLALDEGRAILFRLCGTM